MFRAVFRPYVAQTCCRTLLSFERAPMVGHFRLLSEQVPKAKRRRTIKIPDQLRMASDRLRSSASATGKHIRNMKIPEMARVRLISIAQRPAGVFRRSNNRFWAQAAEGRDRSVARLRSRVQSTRRRVNWRVQSARQSVEKSAVGYIGSMRLQMKRFGWTGLGVYLTLGTLDWIGFYFLFKWGVDVDALISFLGVKKTFNTAGGTASFWTLVGAAYAAHKVMLPARLVLTVVLTRPLWRYLVRKGWLRRPPKPAAKVLMKPLT